MFTAAAIEQTAPNFDVSNLQNPIFITLNTGQATSYTNQIKAMGNYRIETITLQNITKQVRKLSSLKDQTFVIAYFNVNKGISGKVQIKQAYLDALSKLKKNNKVVLVVFGSPYALPKFKNVDNIFLMHEDNLITQSLAPALIFGKVKASGSLPVTLN
jgi:hypothetical protein